MGLCFLAKAALVYESRHSSDRIGRRNEATAAVKPLMMVRRSIGPQLWRTVLTLSSLCPSTGRWPVTVPGICNSRADMLDALPGRLPAAPRHTQPAPLPASEVGSPP